MMSRFLSISIFCFLIHLAAAQTVHKDYTDGRVYVKLSKGLLLPLAQENPRNLPLSKLGVLKNIIGKYGITKASKPYYQASDDATLPYVLKLEFVNKGMVDQLVEELASIRGIDYAEKVPLMTTDITPNDPTIPAQLTQINAPNAWNVFSGNSNITLAIVDNAVMWTHQDLVANTYTNAGEIANNNIDDDNNGYIDDVNGWDVADNDNNPIPSNLSMDHGTHCSGIAGARTDNSIGIASIGWNIKIIPVKTTSNGSSVSSIDDGYGGIIYAAKAKARVISCSWGGSGFSSTEQTVINYAWNKGCLIVAAAGNNNSSTQSYPGAYANVFCVASVGSGNVKSSFSNYGTWVDIAAPGENIYSTLPSATTGTYGNYSGTSMATPLVAGLAALMLSESPIMTQTDVINCISSTAVNIYSLAANSTYSTGLQLGAGRIEAYQAMMCASTSLTWSPIANFFGTPLNTCPNTPVAFSDSSLYGPTSWSWLFQSGTPATSTLTNPSVQWSTPGTYFVTLTVSNANGSNLKSKAGYITVAGPIALPLVEGFQSAPFLPANWTPNNINNDNIYWARTTSVGGFGTSTACAVFDNYNLDAAGDRDEMRTPKYNFSGVVSARLRFDVAYARFNSGFSDSLEVKATTDCGVTWSSIYLKGGTQLSTAPDYTASTFVPTSTQWRRDSIDVTLLTAGQSNVMFSFINHGHYGQALYLDNINLAFPTPTLNAATVASVCPGTAITLTNSSVGASSYTWNFPGGTPATSTATNPSVSYAALGVYTISLIGINGTNTTSITRTVNVTGGPSISVNTPTICPGMPAVLSATGAASYTWASGPTTYSITDSPSITTVYTVTGTNGSCPASKTATIVVVATPTITVNTPTVCSGVTAVLSASGAASYSWIGFATGNPFVIAPSVTTVYTVTGSNGYCSVNKTATVVVNTTPVLTLSTISSTICQGNAANIVASGANSYSWSTGSTNAAISVAPANSTVYTATGTTQGCSSTQTIGITVASNPTVIASANTTTLCAGGSATVSASGANSYTWSTATIGVTDVVTPMTNTTYSVIGSNGQCITMASITVSVVPLPALNVSASPSFSICPGASATLSASGSFTSYSWSGPGLPATSGSSVTITPMITGSYIATGLGPNGCTTSTAVLVFQTAPPQLLVSYANPNCINNCSGSITATGSGGTAPYTYTLAGGSCTTLPCSNLCPGSYIVTMQDALGCSNVAAVNISPAVNNVNAIINFTNASCNTCADGSEDVSTFGGVPPYTYTWTPGGSNQPINNGLLPGCYTVTVMDANGCSTQSTACITASIVTGIATNAAAKTALLIYPNPAQKQVTIEQQGYSFDYVLYDELGQIVVSKTHGENSAMINLENLAKGVYFIEVRNGDNSQWKKLLIE